MLSVSFCSNDEGLKDVLSDWDLDMGSTERQKDSTDTLNNGHRSDQEAARRLARRLYHLEGFRRSDVAKHLGKKWGDGKIKNTHTFFPSTLLWHLDSPGRAVTFKSRQTPTCCLSPAGLTHLDSFKMFSYTADLSQVVHTAFKSMHILHITSELYHNLCHIARAKISTGRSVGLHPPLPSRLYLLFCLSI